MHKRKIISASLLAISLSGASAQAASFCTTPGEMAALRTAAVQQELMVAGLTCQASDAYNRFVLAYRPELQRSDADLKSYFLRREGARGEAAYDTFKTKLANLSSFSDVTNSAAYCANTRAAFAMALTSRQSLASFVADQRLMIALPAQQLCTADPAAPIIAANAPARFATTAPITVSGVPQHSLPAAPYGVSPAAPPSRVLPPAPATYPPQQGYEDQDNDQDYNDTEDDNSDAAPIPPAYLHPPRPTMMEAQRVPYGAPGWPPAWGSQPYPRWGAPQPYPYSYYYYGR